MALVLDYVELAVDDLEQAKAFYSKALGWTFTDYGPDYAGLQDSRNPGQEFGGLNADNKSPRGSGGVMALARTDNASRELAAVRAAGGRVVLDLYEYPGGRRFTFADPWGNILGIYEPAE